MKYAEFRGLRDEAGRTVARGLPAMQCSRELLGIVASLSRLGHTSSAQELTDISEAYSTLSNKAAPIMSAGKVNLPSPNEAASLIASANELRERVYKLRASLWFTLRPWP